MGGRSQQACVRRARPLAWCRGARRRRPGPSQGGAPASPNHLSPIDESERGCCFFVHCLFCCSQFVPRSFTVYSLVVQCLFIERSSVVHQLFTICSLTFRLCSLFVHMCSFFVQALLTFVHYCSLVVHFVHNCSHTLVFLGSIRGRALPRPMRANARAILMRLAPASGALVKSSDTAPGGGVPEAVWAFVPI